MRAFPDPSANVDRDGVGDDFEIILVTRDGVEMEVENESNHSPSVSSSSETPEENTRNEEFRRQKAADRTAHKKRQANAPPHRSIVSKLPDLKSQCTTALQNCKSREVKIMTKSKIWCMASTGMTPLTRFRYQRLAKLRKN